MSQFPYPNSPLPYSSAPQDRGPGAPRMARRASILLLVAGVIGLLVGTCVAFLTFRVSDQELSAALDQSPMAARLREMPPGSVPPGFTLLSLARAIYSAMAITGWVTSVVLVGLGIMVWGGQRSLIRFAAVACGLILLLEACALFGGFVFGQVIICSSACSDVLPAILVAIAEVFLVKALQYSGRGEAVLPDFQGDYARAQQQRQIYRQGSEVFGPGAAQSSQSPIGYGAIPARPAPKTEQSNPPVRHPPLPTDPQNSGGESGSPPPV